MADILVYIEHDESGISDLSLQALALSRQLGGGEALLLGRGLAPLAETLLKHGAAAVLAVEQGALAEHVALPAAHALAAVIRSRSPRLVLVPSSTVGNDLAPLAAGLLEAACVVDCDGVEGEAGAWRFLRTEFDARVRAVYEPVGVGPVLVTVKDGIAEAGAVASTGQVEALTVELPAQALRGSVERREVVKKTVNLKDARVIIGGGAGVGSRENFALLEGLAEKLGGELGATRASVDAGWVSAERQIGQTGVTVRPDLYIACGISGAVQHLVGIRDAKTVVAINSDASAPIFRVSHYRIVGDLTTVVPKLMELLG